MKSIKERVKSFIAYKNISNKQFENVCGLGNGFVSKIGDTIRASKLDLITTAFSELNRDWLIRGVGRMIKSASHSTLNNVNTMDIKDRLKEIRDYANMGQTKFEIYTGISTGYFSRVKGSVGSDTINKILEKFPEIDANWLITGKGLMIVSNPTRSNTQNGNINTNFQGNFNDIHRAIASSNESNDLKKENTCLKKENTSLKNEIGSYKDEVEKLRLEVERLKSELLNEKERLIKSLLKE